MTECYNCTQPLNKDWDYCPICGEPRSMGVPYETPQYADSPYGNISRLTALHAEKMMVEHVNPLTLLAKFANQ